MRKAVFLVLLAILLCLVVVTVVSVLVLRDDSPMEIMCYPSSQTGVLIVNGKESPMTPAMYRTYCES